MTDHKFTDDDVIKTLKNAKYKVDGVVTRGYYLSPETFNAVVDLIGRQEAEIERLQDDNKFLQDRRFKEWSEARAEAIKEFAECAKKRFSEKLGSVNESFFSYSVQREIDTLVKEMTEENK